MSNPLTQTEGGGQAGLLDASWEYCLFRPTVKVAIQLPSRLFLLINLSKVCLHLTVYVVYLLYYFQMFVRLEPTVFLSCFCPLYLPVTDSVPFCIYQLLSGSRRTDITNITGNHCTKGKALPAILVSENSTHSHMFNTFNRVAFDVSAFPFELKPN